MGRVEGLIKILGIKEISHLLCDLLESPFDWVPLRDVNREVNASIVSPWAFSAMLFNQRIKDMNDGKIMAEAGKPHPDVDVIDAIIEESTIYYGR